MDNPKVATTVVELQQKADSAVVQERIASREEVLQTLTGYMHSGEPKDSVRLRAAEMMGKHYGLFTDRIEAVVPVRSAEESQRRLRKNCSSTCCLRLARELSCQPHTTQASREYLLFVLRMLALVSYEANEEQYRAFKGI